MMANFTIYDSDAEPASASLCAKFMFKLPEKIWEVAMAGELRPTKPYLPEATDFDRRRHLTLTRQRQNHAAMK